jgi:hypothetical protein
VTEWVNWEAKNVEILERKAKCRLQRMLSKESAPGRAWPMPEIKR